MHYCAMVPLAHWIDTIPFAGRGCGLFERPRVTQPSLSALHTKTLKLLAQIIDTAIEYELTSGANPARGRRRRVKAPRVRRSWVEPEQLVTLLKAADEYHRPILATLAGAGLRVGEALALNWRDINLATGTLRVGEAKTDAGRGREVDLPGGLIEALTEWKAASRPARGSAVFVTRTGRRQSVTNVDHRLKTAIKAANEQLTELGIEPIGERVSPHSLRRTYASLRAALRDDPVYIAEQLGHTDPAGRIDAAEALEREQMPERAQASIAWSSHNPVPRPRSSAG